MGGSPTRSVKRRAAQTAIWRIGEAMVRLLAPIMSFTCEEVWGYLCKPTGSPDSVHLALLPEPSELTEGISLQQRERLANWDRLIPVRDQVLKSLEGARADNRIGKSLEARVVLTASPDLYPLLDEYAADLPAVFIVSQAEVLRGASDGVSVEIQRAQGAKCERCWKYTEDVGSVAEFPTVCASCGEAVREIMANA